MKLIVDYIYGLNPAGLFHLTLREYLSPDRIPPINFIQISVSNGRGAASKAE